MVRTMPLTQQLLQFIASVSLCRVNIYIKADSRCNFSNIFFCELDLNGIVQRCKHRVRYIKLGINNGNYLTFT